MGEGPRALGAVPGMVPGTACGTPALGSWNCCPLQVEVPKTKTTSSQIITMLASHCCRFQPQKIAKKSASVTGCWWVCEATSEPEGDPTRAEGGTCTLVHSEKYAAGVHRSSTDRGGGELHVHMYTCAALLCAFQLWTCTLYNNSF